MAAFHTASWPERAELAETFEDDRLRELGRRLVFLEQPDALRPELRRGLETWLKNRVQGREGVKAGRTVGDALAELEGMGRAQLSEIKSLEKENARLKKIVAGLELETSFSRKALTI